MLHLTFYALHPTSYILHPTLYTPHPTPETRTPTPERGGVGPASASALDLSRNTLATLEAAQGQIPGGNPGVSPGWFSHPGGDPGANSKSISHRCYLREVAFEWGLTQETIYLPLSCLQVGLGSVSGTGSA